MSSLPLFESNPIATGLWRWSAPHPEWKPEKDRPGGWGRMVGSVCFVPPKGEGDALVLIDPLSPPGGSTEAGTFWSRLDQEIERAGLPVVIFIGNGYHAREAQQFQHRYAGRQGSEIRAHADSVPRLGFEPTRRFGADDATRTGVVAFPIEGLDAGETALFIQHHRALVFSDALIGAGGGRLAVAPRSWAAEGDAAGERYRERFRASLHRLLDLKAAMVLPSHGEPVLARGHDALVAALEAPAWGE